MFGLEIGESCTMRSFVVSGACSLHGAKRNSLGILVGKPEGKGQVEIPRSRWEDNDNMDLRAIGWCGKDWIHLAHVTEKWMAIVSTALTFVFHNILENSFVDERLMASQGLRSMELVGYDNALNSQTWHTLETVI
jgi:hypothetical protein